MKSVPRHFCHTGPRAGPGPGLLNQSQARPLDGRSSGSLAWGMAIDRCDVTPGVLVLPPTLGFQLCRLRTGTERD